MKTLTTKIFLLLMFTLVTSVTYSTESVIAPPDNDLIVNATNLSLANSTNFLDPDVNFPEATATGDGGQQGCTTGVAGVWYKFTATAAGEIGAGLTNDDMGIIVFYSAPNENVTTGQELTHVDQPSNPCENSNFALIQTTIGTTYYIYIKNNIVSDVIINTEEIFAIPENDLIENATNLNGLEDYFDDNVHQLMATNIGDGGQNGCDTDYNIEAVWYKFTAQIDGQVIAGIGNLPNQSAIIFYSSENENATSGMDLTHVDQPNNLCQQGNLSSIDAIAGTTYYIFAATAIAYMDVSINLSGVLGVADNTIEGFSFYPNPVTNRLNLNAKNSIDAVQLFNLLGQKVIDEKVGATSGSLDLSHLQTGLYVMTVSSEGHTASFKVVKK